MLVDGKKYQSIWRDEHDNNIVKVIDQNRLPFFFEMVDLCSVEDVYATIKDMTVRDAPLFEAAAAPVCLVKEKVIPIHIWVNETRPKNKGTGLITGLITEKGICSANEKEIKKMFSDK